MKHNKFLEIHIKLQETGYNKQDLLSNNVNFKSVKWPRINTLLQDQHYVFTELPLLLL